MWRMWMPGFLCNVELCRLSNPSRDAVISPLRIGSEKSSLCIYSNSYKLITNAVLLDGIM